MNFNTFLLRLGFKPDNFKNGQIDPIQFNDGYIYEAEQIVDKRICPYCSSSDVYINDYRYREYRCTENDNVIDILRVKRPRFKCQKCGKTFTPKLEGIDRYSTISNQTKQFIYNDFTKHLTFKQIADQYDLTSNRVTQIFDEKIKFVPRREMPRVLCIDEIRFSEDIDQHFVCVLSDFEGKEIVDLIRNRQIPYLREYFSAISLKERENTKVFISDMYDGYATICRQYFPKAIHIVDLFHVVTQLTNAVNRIRTRVMNTKAHKGSMEYNFMKSHWKYFLCRRSRIPSKYYISKKTGETIFYGDLIFKCIQLDMSLWSAYECLQELFKYSETSTYEEALRFVERIRNKLEITNDELLKSVVRTYNKWRYEIANGFNKRQSGIHYTNAIAEGLNNQLKTIIKSSYGYRNFERFRKRAMLMQSYNKIDHNKKPRT